MAPALGAPYSIGSEEGNEGKGRAKQGGPERAEDAALDNKRRRRAKSGEPRQHGSFIVHKLAVPHDGFVFVGDGRKALFLRNEGDEKFANFVTVDVMAEENPPTHEQGTDRPGRAFQGAHSTSRSAVEGTDWHEVEESRFAQRAAGALETVFRERAAPALVIAAPARTLAELRRVLHADVKAKIIGEIDKDFTKMPVWQIERHIVG